MELARIIYHKLMSNMKYTLELEEFSYREKGREDPRYKTFKRNLMSNTYNTLRSLFEELESMGLLEKTQYEEDVKNGYTEQPSGGSGYLNTKSLNTLLSNRSK